MVFGIRSKFEPSVNACKSGESGSAPEGRACRLESGDSAIAVKERFDIMTASNYTGTADVDTTGVENFMVDECVH